MSPRISPSSLLQLSQQPHSAEESPPPASPSASTHPEQPKEKAGSAPHHIYLQRARSPALRMPGQRELSDQKKAIVKQTYQENRYYHGTGYKREIEQTGMDIQHKTDGAMKAFTNEQEVDETFAATTRGFNYLTQDKELAKVFAREASAGARPPGLVRALLDKTEMRLERDPDMDTDPAGDLYDSAVRTRRSIPPGHLLHHKLGIPFPPAEAIRTFRNKLAQKDVSVTDTEAYRLLRQEQSDSDDDFPDAKTQTLG